MNRLLIALTALWTVGAVSSVLAGPEQRYGWSLSASSTDPFANVTAPTLGLRTVFLWYACSTNDGISAAEFRVVSTGITHVGTVAANGFLNAGSYDDLLLSVGGCPGGPVMAARLLMIDYGGNVCLAPSGQGNRTTLDCQAVPGIHPIDWAGFSSGTEPCSDGQLCTPDAVESRSWGQVKSLYR